MTALPWHTFDSEGRCIAWLHSLPDGTRFLLADDGRSDARIAPTAPPVVNAFDRPVVVVAWPDGSPPEPDAAWKQARAEAVYTLAEIQAVESEVEP